MSVTHQYEVKSTSNVLTCGNTNSISGIKMNDVGDFVYGAASVKVVEIVCYYIGPSGSSIAPFQLAVTGTTNEVIPSISAARVDTSNGATVCGAEWSIVNSELNIYLDVPSTNPSEGIWQFGSATPTLNLKVRVKRQTTGISCP